MKLPHEKHTRSTSDVQEAKYREEFVSGGATRCGDGREYLYGCMQLAIRLLTFALVSTKKDVRDG